MCRHHPRLSEIVVSDTRHGVFVTGDEDPTRCACFVSPVDIRTFTCSIRVSFVLGSIYILDRTGVGIHALVLFHSPPIHVAAQYFNIDKNLFRFQFAAFEILDAVEVALVIDELPLGLDVLC
jgi:hypothetical protein